MRQQRTREPRHRKHTGPRCFECNEMAQPAFLKRYGIEMHWVCEGCR